MTTMRDLIPMMMQELVFTGPGIDLVHLEQWNKLVELHGGDEVEALRDLLFQGIGSALEMRQRMRQAAAEDLEWDSHWVCDVCGSTQTGSVCAVCNGD